MCGVAPIHTQTGMNIYVWKIVTVRFVVMFADERHALLVCTTYIDIMTVIIVKAVSYERTFLNMNKTDELIVCLLALIRN